MPARVYASEKMLGEIFHDRSLEQLVNVATLPGIQKYALAMPDIHEGYGFPVGGVAAFDAESGIISPGGIGYDINCLHPQSRISLPFGTYLAIEDIFREKKNHSIILIKKDNRVLETAEVIASQSRMEKNRLLKIKTKFGFKIKVTGDHPLYTPRGMKLAKDLKNTDQLILYPSEGIVYQEPTPRKIFDEQDVITALRNFGFSNNGNRWAQIIGWLRERGLLGLKQNSLAIPYLTKILGLLFGDGTMNFIGKERRGTTAFYGRKEDLVLVQKDLAELKIKSILASRQRTHKFKNGNGKKYKFSVTENSLYVHSSAFVVLLYLLGAPLGNKTKKDFSIPSWLKNAPVWLQALFSASFFGAEMSKPATVNKYNFYAPTLNINKNVSLKNNGILFLKDICQILSKLGIATSEIVEIENLGNIHKTTTGLRFQIKEERENALNFFSKIGFQYNKEKQKLANLATAYLKYKRKIIELRKTIRALAREHYKKGWPHYQIAQVLASPYAPTQFIEHSIWSFGREEPRISFNFPSFEEFCDRYSYGEEGFIVDAVESIETVPYIGPVYDLTVNHPDHNFIADNFVVSNCGVRLLRSEKTFKEIQPHLEKLGRTVYATVPSGVGKGGRLVLKGKEFDGVLEEGAKRVVEMGYGEAGDLEHLESQGALENADASLVSEVAKSRGRDQLGTMGAGNHFVEVDIVEEIFSAPARGWSASGRKGGSASGGDEEEAKRLGIFKDQVVILIHTGSRGLGHQIATDYIRAMMRAMPKYGISLPDRELACAPFNSPEGQNYFHAMAAGANFAWANRQLITWEVRKAWEEVLGAQGGALDIIYDVAHNIAKVEDYTIDGAQKTVVVHRKGATRSFPGQPVLIPGSMGTGSYLLVGQEKAMEESFGSCCHGAGRRMSRTQAKREVRGSELKQELNKRGIIINAGSLSGLAEEAPTAYKDVDEVVEIVHQAGIAKKIARFKPVVVIKG